MLGIQAENFVKKSGKSSTDVKREMYLTIHELLDRKPEGISLKSTSASIALQAGYSKDTVLEIFKLMEEAGEIQISEGLVKKQ